MSPAPVMHPGPAAQNKPTTINYYEITKIGFRVCSIILERSDALRFSTNLPFVLSARNVKKFHYLNKKEGGNYVFDCNKSNFLSLRPLFFSPENNLDLTKGRNTENRMQYDNVKQHCRSAASCLSAVALGLGLIAMAGPLPSFAAFPPTSSSSSMPSLLVSSSSETIVDPAAADRFRAALRTLQTLDEQWDSLVRGQGDNVRRQLGRFPESIRLHDRYLHDHKIHLTRSSRPFQYFLGTVYAPPKCDSPLCSFSTFATRFVQSHPDLEDSAALTLLEEPLADALEAINQADFLAYSSIFSEYGNGGGGQDYMNASRDQVRRAAVALGQVVRVVPVVGTASP
eukprot:gene28570-37745_t